MEGVILLGLAGIGFLMNKNNDEDEQTHRNATTVRPTVFQNTNSSIYDLNNYIDSKKYEQDLLQTNYDRTLTNDGNMVSDYNAKMKEIEPKSDIIMGIDGNPINKASFLVNDQGIKIEPYYSGNGPPAVDFTRNTGLDRHQGMSDYRYIHREAKHNGVNLQGAPQPFVNGNPFGLNDTGPAMDQSRYDSGMYRTSELPFEQERVSHIDRNSDVNRDVGDIYAQRNGIDNLRALSNPKLTFEGKIIPGKGIDERGMEGQVFKNLPDRDYEQNPDQWLVTTGSTTSAQIRPAQVLPETNRQYLNRQEIGVPGSSVNMSEEKRPMFKKSDKQQLESDTVRNAIGTEVYSDGNHAMDSYKQYANERDVTSERTYEGNVLSNVPDQTVQLQDGVKKTVKETTLDPANPDGFFSIVEKRPEERLKDSPKTSKKETVLFEHTGNARGSTLHTTAQDQYQRADLKVCNHFDYTGNAQGSTLQEMAQDQYYRADLNINKEVIAQGREPVKESTKLVNGGDIMNVDIKKIESDYFNHHQTGVDRVYQVIPQDQPCEYTRDKDTLDNDKLAYRIEGDLLDPFKHNPYTHSLHSFAY